MVSQGSPKALAGVRFPPPVLGLLCANRPAHLRGLKQSSRGVCFYIKNMTNSKEKFNNVCFAIYSEAKHLELYIELLGEFEKTRNSDSELIKIIKNSFGLQIACIFSRIVENPIRKSANIHYIKRFVNSEIKKLSKNKIEEEMLRQLISDIDSFEKTYGVDGEVFKNIKDVGISHNDLVLAKLGQIKTVNFSLVRMTEIANYLMNIFKKFIPKGKDNFKPEFIIKIKNEIDLFCQNM